jgi:L-lactate dehydrogenase complex protein LldG
MNRDAFLQRVRDAARSGCEHRVHLRDDLSPRVGYCGAGNDLVARMAAEVNQVGGQAQVVDRLSDAGSVLLALCRQYGARTAFCWEHPVFERLGLDHLLQSADIRRLNHSTLSVLPRDEQRREILAADIGISSASWTVAETGTLAMLSAPGRERLATLAPPVHVAIVTRSQILPDLFDLFDRLVAAGPEYLPSNLTLITGPSKTGDLELRLTTGVHGPGKWHVIVCREE